MEEQGQARDDGRGRKRKLPRVALAGGLLLLVAGAAIAALLLSGSSNGQQVGERPSWVAHNQQQALYTAGVSSAWPEFRNDKRVGDYMESAWHDGVNWGTRFVVDARSSNGAHSPMETALLLRAHAQRLPRYEELGLKKVTLRGNSAVRWAFNIAGRPRLDYFFEECDVSFVTRGTSPPGTFRNFADDFRGLSYSVEARCND